MNHPLKVLYTGGGIHYMLSWKCHDKQNCIAIAKNKEAINTIAKVIIKKHHYDDLEFNSYEKIDIVAPPKEFCDIATSLKKKKDSETFFISVVSHVSFMQLTELPEVFESCNHYDYKYKEYLHKYSTKDKFIMRQDHIDCLNCYNKISIKIDKGMFYDLYQESFDKEFYKKVSPFDNEDKKYKYSGAREALASDNISCMYTGHRNGISLNIDSFNDYNAPVENSLFYYISLETLDTNFFIKEFEKYQNTKKEFDNEMLLVRKKIALDKSKKDIETIFNIFKMPK